MIYIFCLVGTALCGAALILFYKIRNDRHLPAHHPHMDDPAPKHEWTGCMMSESGKTYPIIEKVKEKS